MPKSVACIAAIAAIAMMFTIVGAPASADEDGNQARHALEQGDIRPLDQVLDVARKRVPGDVVKVKLEHDDGRWKYEIKILTAAGERREVKIDANTLRVLEVE